MRAPGSQDASMELIGIARRLQELGQSREAGQAYQMALQGAAAEDPALLLEAALHILRFGEGEDYRISYRALLRLHREGHFQAEALEVLTQAFYEPNAGVREARYERNRRLLEDYPYLFRRDFPDFGDLSIRFYPFDDGGVLPYDLRTGTFGDCVRPEEPVISRNFFHDLEKPVLAENVCSQYELEYLHDNVRASELVGRENHIYLHYTSWEDFCAWLTVLDLEPALEGEKAVFLIGDEIAQYPIDFRERFGVDYGEFPLKPLGIREIQKLVWHTQLSTHNGGDLFNEVFDGHPNLLAMSSLLFSDIEETVKTVSAALRRARTREELFRTFAAWPDRELVEELWCLKDRTDKDVLVALYLRENGRAALPVEEGGRILPALFFQPHFTNIIYELELDQSGHGILRSQEYEGLRTSPMLRDFRYIKAFTPMRRVTSSHAASVRFAMVARDLGISRRDIGLNDLLGIRFLNRSFLIDPEDRLFKDSVLVRFEDGKLQPEATFSALAAFLDLPYTQSMTYCSNKGRRDPHPETKGFDPAPVYKTYDEFADAGERRALEILFRDAYDRYGYDFQYWDGEPVDGTALAESFSATDQYIRRTWEKSFALAERQNAGCEERELRKLRKEGRVSLRLEEAKDGRALQAYLLQPGANPQALIDTYVKRVRAHRLAIVRALLSGITLVNRHGRPLEMMRLLSPDPDKLTGPLYR